jgi:NodT family efflux transporter outer membrane factor (OMF) lipoprotein
MNIVSRGCVLITGLALTACSLHQPADVALPTELPPTYLGKSMTKTAPPTTERWWEDFNDPQLNGLMDELFAQNLTIEQAIASLDQSRATARQVRSAKFPTLSANAEAGRAMQPTISGDVTGNTSQMAAAASFEIDLWGKLAARSDAAEKAVTASYEDLRTLYLGLAAELADLYYLAVEQRAQIRLTDETIQSFEDTVQRVEDRYRMGLVPALDVYQARQNLAAARATRHGFEANLANAEHAVAVLVGRYPNRESAGVLAILPATPEAFPAGLPAELVGHRPDLRAALRRIEAADQTVAAAIADRFPSINLLGSYGQTRQDTAVGLVDGDFWSLLGSLTLPVFDAGRRRAEVDRTRAAVREAVATYQQKTLDAFREVEDALADSYATEQRIIRLQETEEATGAALRLSLQSYLYGLTDYLPVLTAQRSHFEVQSRLLSVRRQLISDRISLARALGGSWMDDKIEQRTASMSGDR